MKTNEFHEILFFSGWQGYNHTDEFILTQHPLETTVGDFWRMVWDNNSSVIVLLSQVDEEVSRGQGSTVWG